MDNEVVTLEHADDEIAASWKEISAKYEDEPAEGIEVEKPAVIGKPRDETGKFAKVEPAEEVAPEAKIVEAKPIEAKATETKSAEVAPVEPQDRAPSTWKPAAREKWNALDPDIRAEILRREGESHQGFAQIKPDLEFGKAMRAAVDPYRMLIESEGGTPERAVAGLLQTAAMLRVGQPDQKAAEVAKLIKTYSIPIDRLNAYLEGQPAPQQQQEFRDPRFDQFLQNQERQAMQENETVVERWIGEADAQGKPLRPYYQDVAALMQNLLPGIRDENPGLGKTEILQKAYDSAVWANPETRALVQAAQMSELEATRREDNLRRTAEAKKAASVNVPRRGGLPAAAPKGTMDETIRNAARELGLLT